MCPRVKTRTSSEYATGRSYVTRATEGKPCVCQVGCGSQTGSVLVITMSFHSRGILDVGAPVSERWSGIRFPHEGSQQIRWVVQGRPLSYGASEKSA